MLTAMGIVQTNLHDREAMLLECDAIGYELKEAFAAAIPGTGRATTAPAKSKEEVCMAVAKSIKDNKKKGMMRQAAIEKAIADNIADITALGLWRANKGRPNEGDPDSSWKACYQTLHEKSYLKQ